MSNDREYLLHGDQCSRCPESRPGHPPRAAYHHGMCALCWLGATEAQRRMAIFEEGIEADPLEALFALPAVDPDPPQWGEAA